MGGECRGVGAGRRGGRASAGEGDLADATNPVGRGGERFRASVEWEAVRDDGFLDLGHRGQGLARRGEVAIGNPASVGQRGQDLGEAFDLDGCRCTSRRAAGFKADRSC